MERQLNEQRSKLNKERTHNEALKMEVSALIQKQSQRSGRLSRTITWDSKFEGAVTGINSFVGFVYLWSLVKCRINQFINKSGLNVKALCTASSRGQTFA